MEVVGGKRGCVYNCWQKFRIMFFLVIAIGNGASYPTLATFNRVQGTDTCSS
jgi:hypothetical protein